MITSCIQPLIQSSIQSRTTGSSTFDPVSLFGASDKGIVLDFSDSTKLFQSSAGTTAVTTMADPIGYVKDTGPLGKNAVQATAGLRPLWLGLPRTLGTELVTNGRFAADTDWTKGTGWVIALNVATKAAGVASNLTQDITLAANTAYYVFYTITRTAGSVTAQFTGGTGVSSITRNVSGSYCDVFVANSGNTTLSFVADSAFVGTVYSVTVKPITSFVNKGARYDGVDDKMATTAIDFSATGLMTYGFSGLHDQDVLTQRALEIGNYSTSTAGSNMLQCGPNPRAFLRGTSNSADESTPATEAGGVSSLMGQIAVSVQIDTGGAAIADQIKIRTRGIVPTLTPAGTAVGGGNMVNGVVSVGAGTTSSSRWQGIINRVFAINRTLNASDLLSVETWLKSGMVYAAVLGDSTCAQLTPAASLPNARAVSTLCPGLICGAADISHSGDRIANQKTAWTALAQKTALELVIVQVGLNDVKGRVGAGTATSAQVITDLQDLITTIRADVPAACKIYISQLTPCKVWLDAAAQAAAAYAAWQAVNIAIAGGGATPITGVNGRITSHVADLADGSDNLKAIYDYNGDGVHESNEARCIIAQAWRTEFEADGILV